MPRKPARKKRKSRSHRRRFLFRWTVWLQLFIILIFCSAAYVLWLDHRIRLEFEGKRWALPARVYASPMELYAGLSISNPQMQHELRLLGYQQVNRPDSAGEFAVSSDHIVLVSRRFEFWDGVEESRHVKLEFDNGNIDSMVDNRTTNPIPVVRLDPLLIGKIYPEHKEDRVLVEGNSIPDDLINALVAVEDRDFFSHFGIDPKGILRAAWVNLLEGDIRQGGSTLTQQLVKNFFLNRERTLWRKFNEMIMSLILEYHYSKREILSAYVNEIYLGQHGSLAIHGFGTASEYYYSRPLNELQLDQVALLVGLVRGASYYNPRRHPERAKKRRNLVISLMEEQGYLDPKLANHARSRELGITDSPGWSTARYPAFLELVRRQLQNDYKPEDLRNEGLRIFTTLDPRIQETGESTVQRRLQQLERSRGLERGSLQAAGILTGIETGEVLALIGSRDQSVAGFNRALDARRPIGSLIKPAVYLTALARPEKFNVITPLADKSITIPQKDDKNWRPDNYDGKEHGTIALRTALIYSYNLATVRLGLELGIPAVQDTLRKLGIDGNIPGYPSLFLGSLELSPLQVAQMYQTLASNGFRIPLKTIRDVLDKNGNPLQRFPISIRQTLDSKALYLINYLLTQVVKQGTARSAAARLPSLMPLAGKTGTTNDLRDSWFAGFGDNILGVIWLGRDDNKPAGLTGASGALQVWSDIMREVRPTPLSLLTPDGVQWVKVLDGKQVIGQCDGTVSLPFIKPYFPSRSIRCDSGTRKPSSKTEEFKWPWSL